MGSEYDISHCAERVGLVSLRLHTKSRIVPERCSEPVFSPIPIGGWVGTEGGRGMRETREERRGDEDETRRDATSRVNEISLDDDFDLRESASRI